MAKEATVKHRSQKAKRCPDCGVSFCGSLLEHKYDARHVVEVSVRIMREKGYVRASSVIARWCREAKIKIYRRPSLSLKDIRRTTPAGKPCYFALYFYRTGWFAPKWAVDLGRRDNLQPKHRKSLIRLFHVNPDKLMALDSIRKIALPYNGHNYSEYEADYNNKQVAQEEILMEYLKDLFPRTKWEIHKPTAKIRLL